GSVPVVVAACKHQRRDRDDQQIREDVVAAIRARVGAFTSLYADNIVFVERLPKTRSGKILRKMIRSMIAALITSAPASPAMVPTPATIEDDSVKDEIWAALSAWINATGAEKRDI
ncbi:hypothetical protein GGF38_002232, partial [Coemansia sp. RSA 25]